MAGRPVDRVRKERLLDAAVDYASDEGFGELSWRPMAAALGVSTTTLVHHFGTKERLLEAILARLRSRIAAATHVVVGSQPDLAAAVQAIWAWCSADAQQPTFRLFFAVYGNALQNPAAFQDFLTHAGEELRETLLHVQGPDVERSLATTRSTLAVATVRGLLLDLLAGGDPQRVHASAQAYIRSLRQGAGSAT